MDTENCGYAVEDRIVMISMKNDPDPIRPGTKGTVSRISSTCTPGEVQLGVKWDNGRTLAVLLPVDLIEKL